MKTDIKQNVMTIGFKEISDNVEIIRFVAFTSNYHKLEVPRNIDKSDMFVGRPGAKTIDYEDDHRTMIIPISNELPKIYACINETGGLTYMLAEEY